MSDTEILLYLNLAFFFMYLSYSTAIKSSISNKLFHKIPVLTTVLKVFFTKRKTFPLPLHSAGLETSSLNSAVLCADVSRSNRFLTHVSSLNTCTVSTTHRLYIDRQFPARFPVTISLRARQPPLSELTRYPGCQFLLSAQ